ncbi:sulfite exporter TauE/SafE family protein [Spirosoma jeollabukense]
MSLGWIAAALTTGLVGSLHCVGMCGPLAMALPIGRLPSSQRWLAIGVYHLARLTAYAGLGLAIGSVGQGLLLIGLQRPLSIGAGLFLLIWVLLIRGRFSGLTTGNSVRWVVGPMSSFLQKPSWRAFGALGFLNGLLPCGFVYVAMAGAVVTGSALHSGLYMLLFGIGTVPALLAVRLVPTLFPVNSRQRFVKLMPLLTIVVGLLLVLRGVYQPPHTGRSDQPIPLCHGTTGVLK